MVLTPRLSPVSRLEPVGWIVGGLGQEAGWSGHWAVGYGSAGDGKLQHFNWEDIRHRGWSQFLGSGKCLGQWMGSCVGAIILCDSDAGR